MNFDTFKQKLLKDPKFQKEYYKKDLAFEVSQMVSNARAFKALSQAELAGLAGTKQPSIARVENGHLPTLVYLEKLAKAMGTYLIPPKFGFMKDVPLEAYGEQMTVNTTQIYSLMEEENLGKKNQLYIYNFSSKSETINATSNK